MIIIKKIFYFTIIVFIFLGLFFFKNIKDFDVINQSCNIVKDNSYEKAKYDSKETNLNKDIEPIFLFSPIPDEIKKSMIGYSMPKNEPISFEKLSYLKLSYYDFYGNIQIGEMIVDKRIAAEVIDIFKEVFEKKYPIDKIKLIDEYKAVDTLSMSNNNSSSFCYRTIANTNKISNHGKGLAIDINPLQNPHVIGETVNPKEGRSFADRSIIQKGMIVEGDDLYNAFVKRGWSWGGH
ncbi:M15 family metallopeptidase [Romboutsia lituseburensis]|uniref:M15 family metallopeptidase n=1 Tax=Romboutsia lituseburensis TaxID=1537 RepID=UPI00215A539E|nr:M15 family metallopeptidase [Romboutsia lituseburensis]MCR8745040.1 M15 family metallopeptidase [Romboutsia lituseburensis]